MITINLKEGYLKIVCILRYFSLNLCLNCLNVEGVNIKGIICKINLIIILMKNRK